MSGRDCVLAHELVELARSQANGAMDPAGDFGAEGGLLQVVFPSRLDGLSEADAHALRGLPELFEASRGPLESELGARLVLQNASPGDLAPRWLLGPGSCTPELARLGLEAAAAPVVRRLREQKLLVTDAPTVAGLFESLSLLRSFAWAAGDCLEARACSSVEQAFMRVAEEIAHTWPSFPRRGLSWLDHCCRHARALRTAADPIGGLQAMVAELGDAHTAVRRTDKVVPAGFRARVIDRELILHEVPTDSEAWCAGAREGHRLTGVELQPEWQRIGATPQHRPFAVPFRMFSGVAGVGVEFVAVGPRGELSRWTEAYRPAALDSLVAWRRLPSGAGYLRIKRWPSSDRIDELVDRAFQDFRHAPGLVVDLRGNPGGSWNVAGRFRDRFVHGRTRLGSIQFTRPDGELTAAEELWAEPAPAERRWPSPVRFLTDGETYSASEDALLGLQGLAHVEVLGMPSGGGSGRARSVALLPGWRLSVSSCLTFDRAGRCVEGHGIQVDRLLPMARRTHGEWDQALLAAADRAW